MKHTQRQEVTSPSGWVKRQDVTNPYVKQEVMSPHAKYMVTNTTPSVTLPATREERETGGHEPLPDKRLRALTRQEVTSPYEGERERRRVTSPNGKHTEWLRSEGGACSLPEVGESCGVLVRGRERERKTGSYEPLRERERERQEVMSPRVKHTEWLRSRGGRAVYQRRGEPYRSGYLAHKKQHPPRTLQ